MATGISDPQELDGWLAAYPAPDPERAALLERLRCEVVVGYDQTERALVAGMLRALEPLSPDAATVATVLLVPRASGGPDPVEDLPTDVTQLLGQFRTVIRYDRSYLPDDQSRAEGLRRLILALIADVRVVLVVLAWQLARMEQARAAGEDKAAERRRLARETRMIHAPLANRLGIWHLKWRLEDLAFRELEPETYARLESQVAEVGAGRERVIERFMGELRELLAGAGIECEISGRTKHIYSIWRKMQRKGLDFHELFDVRAVRVLVDSLADCYAVLGLVHAHWQPVPGEFDDYISNPKPNLYRSLHTAVTGPGGRVVEVQIRTHEMHAHAELGVAAHWRYKEGAPRDSALEARIGVMRRLLEGAEGEVDDVSLLESFESLTAEDRVYVLTPRGEVIDLAAGATALDFAYHIHTEVGHRCRGAKVNGRIVPLTHVLSNGDRVEILTGKQPRPSRDWLNPQLGYLRTGRARGKVRRFFRQAHYDENLAAGRQAVESELRRLDLDDEDLEQVAESYNFRRVEDLLAAVGAGEYTAAQVAQAVIRLHPERAGLKPAIPVRRPRQEQAGDGAEVRIEGVGNLLYQLAGCCRPVPGDAIEGFITRTRGVSIHRAGCGQLLRLKERQPDRIIAVDWGCGTRPNYPARLLIEAWDRAGLIKDIGGVLSASNTAVSAFNAGRGEMPETVRVELTVEVGGLEQLSTLLARLQAIPNVLEVRRMR